MTDSFTPFLKRKSKKDLVFEQWDTKEKRQLALNAKKETEKKVPMITESELEAIKQQAYQEGMQKANQDINQLQTNLAQITQMILKPLLLVDEEVQQEVLNLTIWFCKECLNIELSINEKKVLAIFDEIKEILPSARNIKSLYLNAEDAAIIRDAIESADLDIKAEHILHDDGLNRGEYRLETETRELDGRIEPRFRELMDDAFTETGSNE